MMMYNRRSQAAGEFAKSAASSTSLQMMVVREELVQRMKTVADIDLASEDDDRVFSVVVFEPSNTDPDLGSVEVQRLDPDRLPPATRPPNAEKKPAVAPPSAESRQSVRGGNGGPAARSAPSQAPASRRSAQMVLCISQYGEKQGELKDPLGVACLSGGEIVVSEWGNRRLQVFDTNGRSLRLIAPGQV